MKKITLILLILFGYISYAIAGSIAGDVDNDGKVNVKEAIHALQTSAGIISAISEVNMQSNPGWKTNTSTIYSDINYNVCIGKSGPAEAKLDVNGYVNAQAHITTADSFFLRGDADKYYAVTFSDKDWNKGPAEFQIFRSSVHTDKKWKGSMNIRIKWHASAWGHGSNYIEYDYRTYKNDFVADIKEYPFMCTLMVWLKGNTLYYYRSFNNRVELIEILGTNNEECVYDPIQHPNDTRVSCNYLTEVKNTIMKGKVIDKGLSVAKFFFVSDGNVGIGTKKPDATLHIKSKEVLNIVPDEDADELVIENGGTTGLSVLSTNAGNGIIRFGDTDDNRAGGITYQHAEDKMLLRVNAETKATIDSDGHLGLGTKTPDEKLDVKGNIKLSGNLVSNQGNIISVSDSGDICIGNCE